MNEGKGKIFRVGKAETTDSMSLAQLQCALAEAKACHRLAFVLGNGINRYSQTTGISWGSLIDSLYKSHLPNDTSILHREEYQEDVSLPEWFDILCMKTNTEDTEAISQYKKEICKEFKSKGRHYCQWLQQKLEAHQVPVLTTNYDDNIEDKLKQHIIKNDKLYSGRGYSETYPFGEYYSKKEIPEGEYSRHFAVWHIHGRINRYKSIRLGISDYMNLLQYTKNYLQEHARLYNVKGAGDEWGVVKYVDKEKDPQYSFTWLNIFYNSSICINGLGLEPNETYLRWLLISRKKYLTRIGLDNDVKGWYVCHEDDITPGKRFFLENVGLEVVVLNDYKERYEDLFDF